MSKHKRNGVTFLIGETRRHLSRPHELTRTRDIEVQLDDSARRYYIGEDVASEALIAAKIERGVFDYVIENIRAAHSVS